MIDRWIGWNVCTSSFFFCLASSLAGSGIGMSRGAFRAARPSVLKDVWEPFHINKNIDYICILMYNSFASRYLDWDWKVRLCFSTASPSTAFPSLQSSEGRMMWPGSLPVIHRLLMLDTVIVLTSQMWSFGYYSSRPAPLRAYLFSELSAEIINLGHWNQTQKKGLEFTAENPTPNVSMFGQLLSPGLWVRFTWCNTVNLNSDTTISVKMLHFIWYVFICGCPSSISYDIC
jgi:hypothetical protein